MNELYNLEQTALEGYTTYNFPKGLRLFTICFLPIAELYKILILFDSNHRSQ